MAQAFLGLSTSLPLTNACMFATFSTLAGAPQLSALSIAQESAGLYLSKGRSCWTAATLARARMGEGANGRGREWARARMGEVYQSSVLLLNIDTTQMWVLTRADSLMVVMARTGVLV